MHFTDTILFDINFVRTLEDLMEIKTRTRSEVEEYTVKMHRNKGRFAIIFGLSQSRSTIQAAWYRGSDTSLRSIFKKKLVFGMELCTIQCSGLKWSVRSRNLGLFFQNEPFGLFGFQTRRWIWTVCWKSTVHAVRCSHSAWFRL